MKFKDLSIGDIFTFSSENEWWSLGMAKGPFIKVSARKYRYKDDKPHERERPTDMRIGSINADVCTENGG